MTPRRASLRLAVLLAAAMALHPAVADGQPSSYSAGLVTRMRAAAQAIAGPRAQELRYLAVAAAPLRLDMFVADADPVPTTMAFPVFQIRFANTWIMVDAALDSAAMIQNDGARAGAGFSRSRYDSAQAGLRGADVVVLTHEHFDHATGVQRGPYFKDIAAKTLLTKAQWQALLNPPARGFSRLSADSGSAFRIVDVELVHPVAPGVVLIKAPGHSPGSQFVYVRLADDREVLLVGDLVWMMPGLELNRQKPAAPSADIQEDRAAIQQQLDWVRSLLNAGVLVAPSHDQRQLDTLVARGVLRVGLDLRHD